MAVGFVLISTLPGKEHEVFKRLKEVPQLVEIHPLFGEYDIIAKVESDTIESIGQIVVDKIRSIEGVIDTKTLPGIKF